MTNSHHIEDVKNLLKYLIFHYENDLVNNTKHLEKVEDIKDKINDLIRALIKIVHDFRYCSNEECSCSPESDIKLLYPKLKDYLKKTDSSLYPIPYQVLEKIIE